VDALEQAPAPPHTVSAAPATDASAVSAVSDRVTALEQLGVAARLTLLEQESLPARVAALEPLRGRLVALEQADRPPASAAGAPEDSSLRESVSQHAAELASLRAHLREVEGVCVAGAEAAAMVGTRVGQLEGMVREAVDSAAARAGPEPTSTADSVPEPSADDAVVDTVAPPTPAPATNDPAPARPPAPAATKPTNHTTSATTRAPATTASTASRVPRPRPQPGSQSQAGPRQRGGSAQPDAPASAAPVRRPRAFTPSTRETTSAPAPTPVTAPVAASRRPALPRVPMYQPASVTAAPVTTTGPSTASLDDMDYVHDAAEAHDHRALSMEAERLMSSMSPEVAHGSVPRGALPPSARLPGSTPNTMRPRGFPQPSTTQPTQSSIPQRSGWTNSATWTVG
jgi:hypothetical protein